MSAVTILEHSERRFILGGHDSGPFACDLFTKGQKLKLSARGLEFFRRNRRWVGRYNRNVRAYVVGFPWPYCAVSVILSGTKTPQAMHCDLLEPA